MSFVYDSTKRKRSDLELNNKYINLFNNDMRKKHAKNTF